MKLTTILYIIGAITLLVGAIMKMPAPEYAPYVYTAGATLFAIMQFVCRYKGGGVVLRRLVLQQQFGGICLVGAGVLMFTHVHNEWIVAMFIGAVLELYTAFRIPRELN